MVIIDRDFAMTKTQTAGCLLFGGLPILFSLLLFSSSLNPFGLPGPDVVVVVCLHLHQNRRRRNQKNKGIGQDRRDGVTQRPATRIMKAEEIQTLDYSSPCSWQPRRRKRTNTATSKSIL